MMVRFINRLFGTEMWVDEGRVEEYKAAGHTPAVSSPAPAKAASKIVPEAKAEEEAAEKPAPKPKPKRTAKTKK
jgi:hypothetical protein